MWAKLILWYIKLCNTGGNNRKTPDDGVSHMKVVDSNDHDHLQVEKMFKRVRKNGCFYLVIYVDNEKY